MHDDDRRSQIRQRYREENSAEHVYIPARPKTTINNLDRTFRVCAYCRVSTDSDDQLSSFELQQAHYRTIAQSHPNWNFLHIYADEGISGTSLKKRDQFNEMIAACEAGEYDLIVTKSVSRFARNLVDCVSLVRRLKNLNPPVGVLFETDNLYTLSENSELMLSFLATFAQEESVKKSESMVWSLTQRFKHRRLLTPALLGYDRNEKGRLIINESEAPIVRFIFNAFLSGMSTKEIATLLTDIACPTKSGGVKWNEGSINYILKNERYCGNVLTWKTFTSDIFEHKKRKNNHDREQYLYYETQEPIVTAEQFEAVQTLLGNRKHHVRGGLPTMHVIDEGVFKGFIPVNHHWVNDDPNSYYEASGAIGQENSIKRVRKSAFSSFNLEGYQVVRGQFLTRLANGPSITITNNRIAFNSGCFRKFNCVRFVQMLLHPTERKMAIRPCAKEDTYSIPWKQDVEKNILSKRISCPFFADALFQIMDWDPEYAYRVRGVWASNGCNEIIAFSLKDALAVVTCEVETEDGTPSRKKQIETFPEEWGESFGSDFYEHSVRNLFHGQKDWKADVKSRPINSDNQLSLLSLDELQSNLGQLKRNLGGHNGLNDEL